MTAAILSIGTEITRGEITNTNASYLAEELTRLGEDVTDIVAIPDDATQIREELDRLGKTHSIILSTGGLGPTTDDITSECVAALLGVRLARNEASLEAIRARRARFGFGAEVPASNAKQADFPEGAVILDNPHGTAPGFRVTIGKATAFFMPGVPREMKPMFATHVAPVVARSVSGGIHQVRMKTFGLPESTVNDRLAGIEAAHGVVIGYRAHAPEIEVKVLARARDMEEARVVAERASVEVRARLADVIFAEGEASFVSVFGDRLLARGVTFGVAEVGTGSTVTELLSEHPRARDFFRGAVVVSANEIATSLLGVPAALVTDPGLVSADGVRALAEGTRRALAVDVALAVAGVDLESAATARAPHGLVHFAVAMDSGTTEETFTFPSAQRYIRLRAAYSGLTLARRLVGTLPG